MTNGAKGSAVRLYEGEQRRTMPSEKQVVIEKSLFTELLPVTGAAWCTIEDDAHLNAHDISVWSVRMSLVPVSTIVGL